FDESLASFQRRGQRTAEMLLDDVAHLNDRDYDPMQIDRVADLMAARSGLSPVAYDQDIIRTKLIGGRYVGNASYFLYGHADEASLRHRGSLVPYARRGDWDPAYATDYSNVDRALRNTMLWTRVVQSGQSYDWTNDKPRWSRVNANYGDPSGAYEGYDAGN